MNFGNIKKISMLFSLAVAFNACIGLDQPVPITTPYPDSKSNASTSSNSDYSTKQTTKVIFNKKHFYNNYSPNAQGCSGDAKDYFDPQLDRIVPNKPNWVKNISLDITNANALYGASNASGCSMSGIGSSSASNCATFDDLQPLSGASSRSLIVGGYGCSTGSSSCGENETLSDVWTMGVPQDSTNIGFNQQASGLPTLSGTAAGLTWAAGDYSEHEDAMYIFGGATPSGSTTTGSRTLNHKIIKINFNSDGTLNTSSGSTIPYTQNTNIPNLNYGSWSYSNLGGGTLVPQNYSPTVKSGFGATFTYGVRRDPSQKTFCRSGDNGGVDATDDADDDDYCTSTGIVAGTTTYTKTEHQDFFLLLGGAKNTLGSFSDTVYLYKPRNYSNDLTPYTTPTGGDFNLVYDSNASFNSIMKMSALSSSGSSTTPVSIASTTWSGRAFHKTVYDPTMNRFYIFGGLSGNTNTLSYSALNELWVYDPPALGRRPTASCYTSVTPEATSLPLTSTLFGTRPGSGILSNYYSNRFVFPTGGCMQKITVTTSVPDARFEHSMAFDRDQKAMLMYGGCTQVPTTDLQVTGGTLAGDPTLNCTTSSSLLKDTWIYLPPTTNELLPSSTTTSSGPYSSVDTTRMPNIFGTDFWNTYTSITKANPVANELLGVWIKLSPSTSPFQRVSGNMVYDRAHHKFYLYGGYGCKDSGCSSVGTLNDVWEFTPPNISADCSYTSATCSSQGTWKQLKTTSNTNVSLPHVRKGALMVYGQPMFSYGDDYYTVQDAYCTGQGPVATSDPSASKQYVGAIYIHIDRSKFVGNENVLINLRMLPFDSNSRLAGISTNATPYSSADDTDIAASTDQAILRVRLMNSPISDETAIMSSVQPRFHEFIAGTPILADTFVYAAGATGQVTEKQILVPLPLDPSIDLIKIERVTGSVKFFEMTLSKF